MLNRLATVAALLTLRRKTIITANALMMLVPMHHAAAQAASPQVISLSCDGTRSGENAPKGPVNNMGIVVNLKDGTVSGGWGVVPRITEAEDANIDYRGRGPSGLDQFDQSPTALVASFSDDPIRLQAPIN